MKLMSRDMLKQSEYFRFPRSPRFARDDGSSVIARPLCGRGNPNLSFVSLQIIQEPIGIAEKI